MDTATKILFTDFRYIDCGDLVWRDPAGRPLGVSLPFGDPVPMWADSSGLPKGIRIESYPAEKHEAFERWPGWGRVVYEGGLYRSWYLRVDGHPLRGNGSEAQVERPGTVEICSAESRDGYSWRERNRCPIEVPGQREFDGQTFLIDPDADAEERMKLVYCAHGPDEHRERLLAEQEKLPLWHKDPRLGRTGRSFCMYCAVSADGESWTARPDPLLLHLSDTDTSVYFEELLGRYVMYTRMSRQGRRWIGRSESQDFRSWSPVTPVLWPGLDGPGDCDLYLNAFTRYPGAPEYRLMFPLVYERGTQRSHVLLYSSDDGMAWCRVPGGPVLEPGTRGSWDSEFISCGKDLMPWGKDRLAVPYAGTPYPHKYPRWPQVYEAWMNGWASWPLDRLSAIRAERFGEFRTMPLPAWKRELRANFRTTASGNIRIGIEGSEEGSLERCDALNGDCFSAPVTWNGRPCVSRDRGTEVVLRIRMEHAELFALESV